MGVVIFATVSGALVLASCGRTPGGEAAGPPQVTAAKVIVKRVQDWDEFTGRFQAVDTVEVRPRVSGYIDRAAFTEGQMVNEGDLLFLIDPRPYQAEYERAKAALLLARSQYDLAQIEATRVQKLKDSGAVSREELDERLSTLHQQEANVQAQKATLATAALNLTFTRVLAPVRGRVSRAEVTRGNLVSGGNNGGTLLTTLVSMDPIYVYFEGDENAYLRYGQMARTGERPSSRDSRNPVRVALANEEGFNHEGYVDFVDNAVNPQTGTVRARAVLANKEGLFTPGLFARVQLLGSGEHEAILIEDRAVGTDQDQQFVLVIGPDNKAEYRKVTLGRKVDGLRVVRDGLKSGDIVIVSGLQRVHPGTPVSPTLQTMGATDTAPALQSAQVPETAAATEAAHNALSLKSGVNTSRNAAKPR
jgi:multidrug efflux system membrane fusion protein